jgi:phosphoglycerate dehydrogenase-like enzyme
MKPLVIVMDDWEGLIRSSVCWNNVSELVEVRFLDEPIGSVPDEEIGRAEYLMAVRERTTLDARLFDRMPLLKLVLQTGGHAYHVDVAAAKQRGVAIALGRRIRAPLASVPELTFALLLGLVHRVYQGNRMMRDGGWGLLTGRTLAGRRLGILGMGRHGSRVAQIARNAFNMEVRAWGRDGASYKDEDGVGRLSLDELLATSDVVSIHLRLSEESKGLLGAARLSQMKPDAILINTARGAIVDEAALVDALTAGRPGGAGLDVFVEEPLSAASALRRLDNVILTPHIGWTVEEVFGEFAEIACTQLREYMEGKLAAPELLG